MMAVERGLRCVDERTGDIKLSSRHKQTKMQKECGMVTRKERTDVGRESIQKQKRKRKRDRGKRGWLPSNQARTRVAGGWQADLDEGLLLLWLLLLLRRVVNAIQPPKAPTKPKRARAERRRRARRVRAQPAQAERLVRRARAP